MDTVRIRFKISTLHETIGNHMRGKKLSVAEHKAKIESDKIERRKVFKELLAHLENGYSLDCFPTLSDTSIKDYLKRYPDEFNEEEFVKALRNGKLGWEDIGRRQANGSCLGNSRSWYYNMVNRYSWHEKAQVETKNEHQVQVNVVSYATKKPSQ